MTKAETLALFHAFDITEPLPRKGRMTVIAFPGSTVWSVTKRAENDYVVWDAVVGAIPAGTSLRITP